MKNELIEKYGTFTGMTPDEEQDLLRRVCDKTKFEIDTTDAVLTRRKIFDASKQWQVRVRGSWNDRPASLKLFTMKPEIDGEWMRERFREYAKGPAIRPPVTYVHKPYEETEGYGYTIDEYVDSSPLFNPTAPPDVTAALFIRFYCALRHAVREPFWKASEDEADAAALNRRQIATWKRLSAKQYPEFFEKYCTLVDQLEQQMWFELKNRSTVFSHAHLTGADVRRTETGYVVYVNRFWRWNQPGYDIAFPIWHQWLALPDNSAINASVQRIAWVWLHEVKEKLSKHVTANDVCIMLLNRIVGALLLDLPARATEDPRQRRQTDIRCSAMVYLAELIQRKRR